MNYLVKILNFFLYIYRNIYRNYLKKNFATGGESVIFYGKALPIVRGEKNIYLGKNVKINEYAYLYARSKSRILIGDNTTISAHAKLITAQYELDKWLKESPDDRQDIHIDKDIIIGNHCWIASNVTILPGVKIQGFNVVVASGSVVTRSFSENNILIGGVPAKIIKSL